MIYHRGGEPERAIHWWLNVMTHKPWITAEFVTIYCSCMSVVSNTSCSHSVNEATKATHYTEVISWDSRAYGCHYAWTYLKRTQLLSVSSLPLSVMVCSCHACVNLSRLRSSGFTSTLHSRCSPSPTRQQAGHIAYTKLPEDVQSSWNI